MSVSESKMDDRTGPLVDVKKWLDGQAKEAESSAGVHVYVCVH